MVAVLKRMSRPDFVSMMLWGAVVANACALAKMTGRQFLSSCQFCANPIHFSSRPADVASGLVFAQGELPMKYHLKISLQKLIVRRLWITKKCFSPFAVLITADQNDKYILAVVLDKPFSNK